MYPSADIISTFPICTSHIVKLILTNESLISNDNFIVEENGVIVKKYRISENIQLLQQTHDTENV